MLLFLSLLLLWLLLFLFRRVLEHTAAFFVVAANVFYFTLFSAFYSSRDGGLATWEHMFTLQWYQSGGGDVLHYYVLLDCVMNPFVLAVRTGRQRMIRAKKLRKAVCQEQLNQVHTGIELDYMCEYLLALVCPAISIVLCQGLPMLPCTFVVVWWYGRLVVWWWWCCLIGLFLFFFTVSDIVCWSCVEVLQFETCFVLRIGGALVERRNIGAMG